MVVKLVVQVKLLPTPEQAPALSATLHTVNTLANEVSAVRPRWARRRRRRGQRARPRTLGVGICQHAPTATRLSGNRRRDP
ncbi:hypothetical protein ACGFNU_15325 [Spirillospora sp. NPDC048911]|uniref:hypothetical protein n=1 Tax=Spirillospora sp. NPDC048911 TaxID=3364527 RepID=UPI00371F15B0